MVADKTAKADDGFRCLRYVVNVFPFRTLYRHERDVWLLLFTLPVMQRRKQFDFFSKVDVLHSTGVLVQASGFVRRADYKQATRDLRAEFLRFVFPRRIVSWIAGCRLDSTAIMMRRFGKGNGQFRLFYGINHVVL